MPARRTIGLVTTSFPRFEGDSAGIFVQGMARSLAMRDCRVEVVVPQSAQSQRVNDFNGVTVVPVPYMRPIRLQTLFFGDGVPDNLAASRRRLALVPPAMLSLFAEVALRSRSWDAVISHWLIPSGLMTGLAVRGRIPHLAVAHSGDVHLLTRMPLGRMAARAVSAGACSIGFISRALEEEFSPLVSPAQRRRHVQLPMGFFPEEFRCDRSRDEIRRSFGLDRFTVLFLGRLVPIKGLDVLLRALAGLPDVQLVVAGDGQARNELEHLSASLNIKARFVGPVGTVARAELLAACDVLAVPSRILSDGRHEGLPLTVVEGLAAGIPVLATRTGAIPELLTGALEDLQVPPDDALAIRRAIVSLMGGAYPLSAMKKAGKEAVSSRNWHYLAGDILSRLFNT